MHPQEDSTWRTLLKSVAEWPVLRSWILIIGIAFIAFIVTPIAQKYVGNSFSVGQIARLSAIIFFFLLLALILAFFAVFNGPANEKRLGHAVTYSYVFVMFALFGTLLPFFFLPHLPVLMEGLRSSPIGVVRGCSAKATEATVDLTPGELRCAGMTNQWVVNFGGVIWRTGSVAAVPKPKPVTGAAGPTTADKEAAAPPAVNAAAAVPVAAGMVKTSVAAPAVSRTADRVAAPATPVPAEPSILPGDEDLNVIQGGLVVPLYVVLLSFMGAAVSMTRRVPEYQRRLSLRDPELMSYDQARETLVFQVMQVFSAPLIAVTMYYLVDPGSRASTIVLAFASGFSSETILLAIRAFLEKIKPAATLPVKQATNIGVSPGRLDFGTIGIDETADNVIAIVNPTAVALEVMSVTCTGNDEFSIDAQFPMAVDPGHSRPVKVMFKPRSTGLKKGVLVVTDNAPGSPRSIEIFGEGVKREAKPAKVAQP